MMKVNLFLATLMLCLASLQIKAQTRKAPAYPLITHNPNFSIWSASDHLTDSPTQHWTGVDHSLLGLIKVDGKIFRFLGKQTPNYRTILPASDQQQYQVRYTTNAPEPGWSDPSFDSSSWKKGFAPIGDDRNLAKTEWKSEDIWVRRTFNISSSTTLEKIFLKINHDDNIEVFLNGKPIYKKQGWTNSFKYIPLNEDEKKLLKAGENLIAIHLTNTAGGRFLDFGIVEEERDTLGAEDVAIQNSVDVQATQTIYSFTCGEVDLKLIFTSPLLLKELDILARPVSYVTFQLKSKNKNKHNVKVLISGSSDIAVYTPSQKVVADKIRAPHLSILKVGTVDQPVLKKSGDDMRIDWGYFYLAAPKSNDVVQFVSSSSGGIHSFKSDTRASDLTKGTSLSLNTIIAFEDLGNIMQEKFVALAYDEINAIEYFNKDLKPWWNTSGKETMMNQLAIAVHNYPSVMQKCTMLNKSIYQDAAESGGKEYAHLCVLAYRQSIAAHTLVKSPQKDLLWLSKENNSGGFINTVDVTYPSAPLYLLYNPELLKGMLNGIFYFSESGKYAHPWAAHDLGTYPIANGQTYGEPMPVEESGNMIILTAAITKVQGKPDYARKHWSTLTKWVDYLTKEGLDPKKQLCTDDFAGHLARNANLSVKAIVAIACYSQMAERLGFDDVAKKYKAIAAAMVPLWINMANANDHFALTFDDKNTWSQKYNLIWDKVLKLNLFPQYVYDTEIQYYLKKQNKYGLPLDSRKSYTKNDWIVWSASLASTQQEFQKLIHPVYKHAIETESRVPLNDFYDSTTGLRENFKARSVVGGFYMKILSDVMIKGAAKNE